MAELLLDKGEIVVATASTPSDLDDLKVNYSATHLLVLKLDVHNVSEVKNTFVEAQKAFGRVDVVFNNAGHALVAEAESTPDTLARKLFEVIFWGAVHVSQEAVRFFREENSPQGGHLIQNSASSIWVNIPLMGFYTASKCGK